MLQARQGKAIHIAPFIHKVIQDVNDKKIIKKQEHKKNKKKLK